jgi:hypothetical protein
VGLVFHIRPLSPTDVAWSAGLFEGEGCIEITCKPDAMQANVRLVVASTDYDVLERFLEVVGCGRVHERSSPSMQNPLWRRSWQWRCSKGREVHHLLGLWIDYFGERRAERADEAMALLREGPRWRAA